MSSAIAKIDPEKTHLIVEQKHTRPLTSCYWEPQGRFIFFGAEDNLVHRYDVSRKAIVSLAAHDSWIRAMGADTKGEILLTGGYDGRLAWWPLAAEKPEPIRIIEAHDGWVRSLSVDSPNQRVATCGNDKLIKIWSLTDGTLIRTLSGHDSHVYNVCFSSDGKSLASCDLKGIVKAWDLEQNAQARDLAKVEALHKYDTTFRADIGGARCIALRQDGGELALGGITNVSNAFAGVGEIAVALIDWKEAKLLRLLEAKEKTRSTAWGIAHHPEGFWVGLAGGGGGGWLYFWKGDSANEFAKLKLKNDGRGMSLSPDSNQVAVAHADSHLRIYGLYEKA